MENNKVLLLTMYNEKAPGVRYLANYLVKNGFDTKIVFLKGNIYETQPVTKEEINILKELIKKEKYLFIGLSILSSFTLNEIKKIIDIIRKEISAPLVIGGAYPTIMHKECAKLCDIVLRGEGEIPIVKLAKALQENKDWKDISNLCFYNKNGEYIQNEIDNAVQDLDEIGYPIIGGNNMYLIDGNKLIEGDPQLNTEFYELTCSRGCPFNCSYCYSSKFRELYKGKGRYLRFRSVDNVMEELLDAIEKNPRIKEIRFWDEVFSNENGWIEDFVKRYKKEINLPFHIWGHPLVIKEHIIEMLKEAGLQRIVVGFQSGSPNVRNNIFRRKETNEQIIQGSKIISLLKIPEVYYDLMICHPLESLKEIKETFDLCLQLEHPFKLNIHGLGFLPGTDIIEIAIEKQIYTKEELEEYFNASEKEQLKIFYGTNKGYYGEESKKAVWADLIYLTQFPEIRKEIIKLSKNADKNCKKIKKLKEKYSNTNRLCECKNNKKGNIIESLKIFFTKIKINN
ncbi:B12-binding domain-containing radical SAM protein [bacterium]|nr:B12-binding domain-containing radical SAM protein [bacterium]